MKETTRIRKIAVTAMLSAVAAVLMALSFSVPLMPSFIKMDFSELPALLAGAQQRPLDLIGHGEALHELPVGLGLRL